MIQTKLSVSTAQALKLGITFQSFFMFIYASLNFGSGCRKNGLKLDFFFSFSTSVFLILQDYFQNKVFLLQLKRGGKGQHGTEVAFRSAT